MRVRTVSKDKRTADGITFASKAEMEHYLNLKSLQQRGVITNLKYEPKFTFVVNNVTLGVYRPDFSYLEGNQVHIVDVKGWKKSKKTGKMLPRVNREFGLKVKLMKACFDLDVEIV